MGEVTYPDEKVIEFLSSEVIPIKLDPDGELSERFFVRWTPMILGLDPEGNEHHRQVGFLPPEQYLASLMLMNGKCFFEHRAWERALDWFSRILAEHPGSFAAPQAIYLGAVSRYRLENDAAVLRSAQERIKSQYPDSEWAARMLPYRLIGK